MTLETILAQLEKVENDIKAESLLAVMLRNGFEKNQFLTRLKGTFKRPHSRDINGFYLDESSHIDEFISIELNRNGLYDALPEGLFHQPMLSGDSGNLIAKYMAQTRANRNIEADARKLFLPLEHEVFLAKLSLEDKEQKILEDIQEHSASNLLFRFWGLKYSKQVKGLNMLVYLLPMLEKVVGNFQLTEACYELILGEKIRIRKTRSADETITIEETFTLEDAFLGQNTVIGNTVPSPYPVVEIEVGPLKHFGLSDYINKGVLFQTLQLLHEYFIPVEAEVREIIFPSESESGFILGDQNQPAYMGYFELS